MPRTTRNSKAAEEEDPEGLLNHCNACGDYHDGVTGPECPIYKAQQEERRKKKSAPKNKNQKEETGNKDSEFGSSKVVSLLENIALGMDQLLKQGMEKSQDSSDEEGPSKGGRRRSKSVPPKRKDPPEETDPPKHDDPSAPTPAQFAAMGLPAALAKIIPGLTAASSTASSAKAKSGEHRTASDNVVCHFKWPQEHIYSVSGVQLSHDNMSMAQFVRGFIAMINAASLDIRPYMLTHLSETMLDAERFTWESVRNFQKEVFHGIEAGEITFRNLETINLWRLRHSFDPFRAPKQVSVDTKYGSSNRI